MANKSVHWDPALTRTVYIHAGGQPAARRPTTNTTAPILPPPLMMPEARGLPATLTVPPPVSSASGTGSASGTISLHHALAQGVRYLWNVREDALPSGMDAATLASPAFPSEPYVTFLPLSFETFSETYRAVVGPHRGYRVGITVGRVLERVFDAVSRHLDLYPPSRPLWFRGIEVQEGQFGNPHFVIRF